MKVESIVIAYHHEAVNFSYSRTHSPSGGESCSEHNLMMVVDIFRSLISLFPHLGAHGNSFRIYALD